MAVAARKRAAANFVDQLSARPFCETVDPTLTDTQKFALHEFLHTVAAAGYKLYQIVPPDIASKTIHAKFGDVLSILPNPDDSAPTPPPTPAATPGS